MLLVVGMQNDKLSAMAWGGEKASLHHGRNGVVPTASVTAFCSEVNRCIEFASAAGWRTTYVLDLHHPMHCSFQGHGGALHPHCVLSSWGCNPVSGLHYAVPGSDLIIRGVDADGDSSDAFWITEMPHPHAAPTRLFDTLGCATTLVICGASPDGCIENTAASAVRYGIRTCAVSTALWLRAGVSLDVSTVRIEDV